MTSCYTVTYVNGKLEVTDTDATDINDPSTPATDIPAPDTPAEKAPDEDVTNLPKTGDGSLIYMWGATSAASAAGIGAILAGKKRKEEDGEAK